jgi:hypothetical protein
VRLWPLKDVCAPKPVIFSKPVHPTTRFLTDSCDLRDILLFAFHADAEAEKTDEADA